MFLAAPAAARLVAIVCAAQVFVQLGAGYWPVLLPELMGRWSLSNSQAGWITSAFYAAYMVCVDAKMMSRAVTGHAASIGISGAASYVLGELLAQAFGWRLAFASAGLTAAIAWLTVALAVPGRPPPAKSGTALFDFRPVLRNRSAVAYSLAYCVHTLEMNALRGWGVAFLTWVAASAGLSAGLLSPAVVITALGLLGTVMSVLGNEASIRLGRRRLITAAMGLSIVVGASIGFLGSAGYWIAVGLIVLYGMIIWLDSSSLTAGAAGSAEPSRRGAQLAVHSMLGYAGGFVGPLAIGWTLDAAGGMSALGWGLSFAVVAALMAMGLVVFTLLRPGDLEGD